MGQRGQQRALGLLEVGAGHGHDARQAGQQLLHAVFVAHQAQPRGRLPGQLLQLRIEQPARRGMFIITQQPTKKWPAGDGL